MKIGIAAAVFGLVFLGLPGHVLAQEEVKTEADKAVQKLTENQQKIQSAESAIQDLSQKIAELQGQRDSTAIQASLIDAQVKRLTQELAKAQLELERTELNMQTVAEESETTAANIDSTQQNIIAKRQQLRALFRRLYEKEQESFLTVLLKSGSLSEVLAERSAYAEIQNGTSKIIQSLQQEVSDLEKQQGALEQQQADLRELSALLEVQQAEIASQKNTQKQFLAAKRSQQAAYENLLAEARQAREERGQDLFTLKGAGVKLTLTAASDIAKFAGQLTGVRPALLLAVLKVESNVGNNIGGGKFPDDMHPASREAFLRLIQKLKLDPHTIPISARPKSYSGWGGAMGPAQIMPQTWEVIESRLSSLIGKPIPNPYELTDAFVATALLLADKGAANAAQEYEAVNRYLAGPNWQRFTWYGDRVLAVAKEYESSH